MQSIEPRTDHYTAGDGRRLSVHVWSTLSTPRVRVVYLHGISSHAGWYNRSNEHLANAGVEVHFLNRRGSGADVESRGDVDRWQTWIDDVAIYLRQVRDAHAAPAILCGISWGGKLAAAAARRHPELVGGLGLICPGLYSPFEPGVLKRLALRTPVPQRIQRRRLAIPLRDPALFTDTPAWQTFITEDPLTLRDITWRFAREDRALTCYARHSASFLNMPLLVMLAGRDRIIDNRRVRNFYERVPIGRKTVIDYANSAHTLEFEPDPQAYFADLAAWLHETSSRFGTS